MPAGNKTSNSQAISGFRAHPWHGVSLGENWPGVINAYIEVVPHDTVKYGLDKETGILKIIYEQPG
ncbi:MAG: hypothetical protein R6U91_06840 [Bacillota bacterium]